MQAGSRLGRVLVLQERSRKGGLTVTRKASLLAAGKTLPCELAQCAEGALVPGYVASITDDSVFVRFLKDLTGRAGGVWRWSQPAWPTKTMLKAYH